MANKIREKMKLTSVDDLLGVSGTKENRTEEIEISLIHPFKNHPFKVVDDQRMDELVDSIINQGVLSPVLVRPNGDGTYEMISGHRRIHAAKRAQLKKIPAIVMDLNDDESTIIMVDANLQREELLPSERAFSFKMKMDAMRHQGACRHNVDKLNPVERKTATIVGEGSGLTGRSVQRYIKLTYLLPELLEMVDNKQLSLVNGVDISGFDKEVQEYLLTYIKEKGKIHPAQLNALKAQPNLENLTPYTVMTIMKEAMASRPKSKKVSFTEKKLNKFFPADYSANKREQIIIELLTKWKEEHGL
ncbi:ParB/RepB/Spo0J family partition protein [Oribacterium sp. WCC10]|uniref:ParB/RepB/Spo0J family partition protein n=1 Tax=Oribacterium sp. WCC10 TaxID=1855343 RepID=UPI0008F1BDF6|nr:ParB/RepB/Spo0J family partition protein [Oribacterium sp. WCC10]SFG59003.1 chromosome partitioning protein, ParB family [Oribacterium sp. WCC10]